MIDPSELDGKRLAMVMWGKHADGRDDVVVFAAPARWNGVELSMRFQPPQPTEFRVEDEWLPRIKPVPDDLREIMLHADYCFSVTVGDLNDEEIDPTQFYGTGLVWPDRNKKI